MFSFFKRWRNKDKEQAAPEVVEEVSTQEMPADVPVEPSVSVETEPVELAPENTALEVVPEPVEIPAPTLVPEPVVPVVNNLPDLPEPDVDGKIRIKVTLNDVAPPSSDEELEAAALAEIPEDSPLRYQQDEAIPDDSSADEEQVSVSEEETAAIVANDDGEQVADEVLESEEDILDCKIDCAWEEETAPEEVADTVEQVLEVDEGQEVVHSATPAVEKASWFSRLKSGLARTGSSISSLFVGVKVDEDLFEELETALIMADSGVEATQSLLTKLRAKVKKERIEDAKDVKKALHELLTEHLKPLEKRFVLDQDNTNVVMIAGVNGAGKTTSIGKLAHHFQASGASVLLAAGDTFRAAAREQLIAWGARNNVQVISQDGGDPAAVAFDAVNAGRARKTNVVMVDTAGRLPTQTHLMEELKKIKRVITKADNTAPHEVLLVIDGNTGQNALAQIRAFDAVLGLTGLVVTKLDGTAKGGTLAAVAAGSQGVRPVPVYWIGVGESLHDLQPFVASEFAAALLGDDV
ncbi:MAG: signal recognition particle-docking protein FtsY [Pelistega sp.]|nr:signal recognition particle-docking protein FtsY [Pelistega sp.]